MRVVEWASAHLSELTRGTDLLAEQRHREVWGDNASIRAPGAADLARPRDVRRYPLPRANPKKTPPPPAAVRRTCNGAREISETVNRQLTHPLPVETNHAHTGFGLTARLDTKLAAHTLGISLNRLLGSPAWLPIKRLAFPI